MAKLNKSGLQYAATNTAINALVAAGPNKIGSVRNIKLIRGKSIKRLDVYEFIF